MLPFLRWYAGVEMRLGVAGVRPFLEEKLGLHHASPGEHTSDALRQQQEGRLPYPPPPPVLHAFVQSHYYGVQGQRGLGFSWYTVAPSVFALLGMHVGVVKQPVGLFVAIWCCCRWGMQWIAARRVALPAGC